MAIIQHPLVAESVLTIEPLAPSHDRAAFVCKEQPLTDYIRGEKALRDVKQRNASVYCCVDERFCVKGFYTLSIGGILRDSVARAIYGAQWQDKKRDKFRVFERFPYPSIGVIILGRVAIDLSLTGHGLGTALIGHALNAAVSLSGRAGARAVYLDAKNERVAQLYEDMGFQRLPDNPLSMFILIETLVAAAEQTQ
ncbi:MAG: GCN5-related N-acetyltransferase [Hymenobacter sp.]|nr:GCN5-related N-acetyltransferase [Hymenobacter sp.]